MGMFWDFPISAVWENQGVTFREKYKSNKTLLNAVNRTKKYEFVNAVNYKSLQVFHSRSDLLAKSKSASF